MKSYPLILRSRDRSPSHLIQRQVAQVMTLAGTALLWSFWRHFKRTPVKDRTVVVTGGSRGLGKALAREFLSRGAKVAICARDDAELQKAKNELEESGGEVFARKCDVTRRVDVDDFIAEVVEHFGSIDVLVNNAGIMHVGPAEVMNDHEARWIMEVNFWGVRRMIASALPWMRGGKRSQIINITSIGGEVSVPHLLSYSCSKAAELAFSRGLSAELAEEKIKVLTIVPNLMRTGSFVHAWFKGKPRNEYRWFKLAATLPLLAIASEKAAREIVDACEAGKTHLYLGRATRLIVVLDSLAPGAVDWVFSRVNAVLPQPQSSTQEKEGFTSGKEVEQAS